MFKKVIIAEDFNSYNIAIKTAMEDFEIPISEQVYYCDDAILKIKKSILDNEPYELLITDLSFINNQKNAVITDGGKLIEEVKKIQPSMKILVFSIENRVYKINMLFEKYQIDGFVTKGREDIKKLKKAIIDIYAGIIEKPNKPRNSKDGYIYEFENKDIEIVSLLSNGISVRELSMYFKKNKITPNSESYIEKKLSVLRQLTGTKNTGHLIFKFAELGLIE